MRNRGQVTIFIIVAVLIIAGAALFFTLRGTLQDSGAARPEVASVKSFVEECLDETSEKAVYELGQVGGYNSPEESTDSGISYYIVDGNNYLPSKEILESEISDYVNKEFFLCTLHYVNFPELEIEQSNFDSVVDIQDESVFVEADYSLAIKRGESVSRIEDFETEVPVRLGIVHEEVSNFIVQEQVSEGICLSCLSDVPPEMRVELSNLYGGVSVFTFVDEDSFIDDKEFEWRFANKY